MYLYIPLYRYVVKLYLELEKVEVSGYSLHELVYITTFSFKFLSSASQPLNSSCQMEPSVCGFNI